MLLVVFLCNIVFIPLSFEANTTSNVHANSTVTPLKESLKVEDNEVNKTKAILVSEGGAIIQNTPSLLAGKENTTIFSYKELGKDTAVGPSRVVPRKGVVYKENSTDLQSKQDNHLKETNEKPSEQQSQPKKTTVLPIVSKSALKDNSKASANVSTAPNKKTNMTVLRKKPMILSYNALANSGQSVQDDLNIPAIKSSSKSMIQDQMPSPRKETGPITKVQPMSASRHPGMIMPVVITILVVPMFAVLGYMALRRGQEAWKNRHYKRMDFLLDGMYND